MYRWYLVGLSLLYAIAFLSADVQLDALYGSQGLIPKSYPDESYLLNALQSTKTGEEAFRSTTAATGRGGNTNLLGALMAALEASWELDKSWGNYDAARALCNLGVFMRYTVVEWFHVLFRVNALLCLAVAAALCIGSRVTLLNLQLGARHEATLYCGSFATAALFAFFWLSYSALLSYLGDTFFHFQWDILLLEMGALGVVAALSPRECGLTLFCIRVLAFKLLFLSGVVKVHSQCPTWLGLTALDYHYATQCLPTPLAYYAHVWLSPLVQSFSVAATLVLQTVVSLFFLLPFPSTTAATLHVGLQLMIAATGNYTFFNLAAALLVGAVYLAPLYVAPTPSYQARAPFTQRLNRLVDRLCDFAALGALAGVLYYGFAAPDLSLKSTSGNSSGNPEQSASSALYNALFSAQSGRVLPMIGIQDFDAALRQYLIPVMVALLVCSFVVVALRDAWMMLVESYHQLLNRDNLKAALASLISILIRWTRFGLVSLCCFCLVSFNASMILNDARPRTNPGKATSPGERLVVSLTPFLAPPMPLAGLSLALKGTSYREPFIHARDVLKSSVHSYGLFRHMTGVGRANEVARPEVVLEGTFNGVDWFEFDFSYKPGNVTAMPRLVAPHQPRLDWQMWFAALSPQPPGWLVRLAQLLLQGRQLDIMAPPNQRAIDLQLEASAEQRRAGKDKTPLRLHSVRAFLYDYDFHKPQPEKKEDSSSKKKKEVKQEKKSHLKQLVSSEAAQAEEKQLWWKRWNKREYLPALTLQDPRLKNFIKQQGWDAATIKKRLEFEQKHLNRVAISEPGVAMLALTAAVVWLFFGLFI